MKNVYPIVFAVALFVLGAALAGPPQSVRAPADEGAACIQDGIGFLKDNDLLQAAAQKQIDYDTLDSENAPEFDDGAINADLPAGSNLSLGQVVKLHKEAPALFDWCE